MSALDISPRKLTFHPGTPSGLVTASDCSSLNVGAGGRWQHPFKMAKSEHMVMCI